VQHTVLHMFADLAPGGEELQVLTLVQGLDRSRWRSVVCTARGGMLEDRFRAEASLHIVGKGKGVDLRTPIRIRKLIDAIQPDIVHTHLSTMNTWSRIAVGMKPWDRPIVIAHEGNVELWKKWYHILPDRALMPLTDVVCGVSTAVARYIVNEHGLPEHKVRVLHNGIDLSRSQKNLKASPEARSSHRRELGLSDDDFVIGHIGRPAPQKGLEVLAKIMTRVKEVRPRAKFLRVSQPPLPAEEPFGRQFDEDVRRLGLEDTLVRHPFTMEISDALMVMDALVQTSHFEGLGNAVIEAMSMEVPVVVTAAGGTQDVVIHGDCGWMRPVGDVEGLAEGLVYIMDNPEAAGKWGVAGRERAESKFSAEAYVQRTADLYEELLSARERKSS
jgi:L-malate glycosyltransferase